MQLFITLEIGHDIIVRRRALLRMRPRKRSKAAVKRTIKAQIAIRCDGIGVNGQR
jgi:hypothetical protein